MTLPRSRITAGLAPALLAALVMVAAGPWVRPPPLMLNTSPSEPTGLYALRRVPVVVGERIAFRVPAPGRAYAAAFLPARAQQHP